MFALRAQNRDATPDVRRMSSTRLIKRLGDVLEDARHDTSGNVAVLFALMLMVMLLGIGGAVDFGRWLHARRQTISAMDAAVLAGGRALQLNSKDTAGAIAAATKYYQDNIKTRIPVKSDDITFAPTDNGTAFSASGNAYIATPILALANINEMPLINAAKTEYSKAQLQVGGNAEMSIEIALMADTSGSMQGQKIRDLKDAAEDLVDIVIWDDQSQYTSKMAIVPFSADMRPPASMLDAVRGSNPPNIIKSGKTYRPVPCVVERIGTEKFTDAPPGPGQYVTTERQTNSSCTQPASDTITPLTNSKTALHAAINGLTIAGSTAGHLGTAWSWYALSPNWAPYWPSGSGAQAYDAPKLMKIAILMTDGEYNTQYTADGISGTSPNGDSNTQARALCDGMKAQGITVYTVGFQLGGNQTAIGTLNYCATTPGHFYDADDGEQLKSAFRDIALKISSLYLSR